MIAKGTTHNNGVKLAHYLTTGKDGERAEMYSLRGFVADNITDAFRDVHIMAKATQCEQPFFHVQVRNREGEKLTRQQWEVTANRIERMLGLGDQPRAIAFHIHEGTGDEHMHVAWSRIDETTFTAKHLPFFKERLKKISRELELHFGLPSVRNEREGPIIFAPTRAEGEHARRHGVDVHEIRNTIRDCFDRSDCGKSFQAALEYEGMILAQGDRRSVVVIDRAGGIHALGKRILDVTVGQVHKRLADLDRGELPTVEQARENLPEFKPEKQPEKPAELWDRDRADRHWQDAVINAAIEHEKVARNFIEPRTRVEKTWGSREKDNRCARDKDWPIHPPQPKQKQWTQFEKASSEATRDIRTENLAYETARVWKAYTQSDGPKAFAAALDEQGLSFARATKDEAYASERKAAFAQTVHRQAPTFKQGEIVIITEPRPEYRRKGEMIVPARIHKLDQTLAAKFMKSLASREKLASIERALKTSDERAVGRAQELDSVRYEQATRFRGGGRNTRTGHAKTPDGAMDRAALRTIGKALDVVSDMFDQLLSPTLTPEQKAEGQKAAWKREAEADHSLDAAAFTAQEAQKVREDHEMAAERQRQRDRDRGGRDR